MIAGQFNELQPLTPPSDSWASIQNSDVAIWLIDLEPKQNHPSQQAVGSKRVIYHVNGKRIDLGGTSLHPKHGTHARKL